MKLPWERYIQIHASVGCAKRDTECGVILFSKQLRGAEFYNVRSSLRA
jgi:hypothetical protein